MAQAIRIDLLQISRSHIVQLRERVGQRHLGFEVVTDPRRMFTTLARLTLNLRAVDLSSAPLARFADTRPDPTADAI